MSSVKQLWMITCGDESPGLLRMETRDTPHGLRLLRPFRSVQDLQLQWIDEGWAIGVACARERVCRCPVVLPALRIPRIRGLPSPDRVVVAAVRLSIH